MPVGYIDRQRINPIGNQYAN